MRWGKWLVAALVGTLLGLAGPGARADMINIYSTGVDASHSPLPGGSIDPHYALTTRSDGVPGTTAYVVNDGYPIAPDGPWVANDGVSKWIGPNAGAETVPNGPYFYTTTFDLTGLIPGTAELHGYYTADDQVSIWLNGVQVAPLTPDECYGTFFPFSITSNFIGGLNTLEFQTFNTHGFPTGLRVEISGTASAVPEPSTIALSGIGGLTGLVLVRRRRGVAEA